MSDNGEQDSPVPCKPDAATPYDVAIVRIGGAYAQAVGLRYSLSTGTIIVHAQAKTG